MRVTLTKDRNIGGMIQRAGDTVDVPDYEGADMVDAGRAILPISASQKPKLTAVSSPSLTPMAGPRPIRKVNKS